MRTTLRTLLARKNTGHFFLLLLAAAFFFAVVSFSFVYAGGGPGGGNSGSGGYTCGNIGREGGGAGSRGSKRSGCGSYGCGGGGKVGRTCQWQARSCPPPPPPPPNPEDPENPDSGDSASQPCYDAFCSSEQALYQNSTTTGFSAEGTPGGPGGIIVGEPESKANPELTINAVPFLVHSGENSTISWSADEVLSCLVSGPNFDFEGTEGEEIATNIIELSTYTLTCNTEVGVRTASVAVSIIPVFQEI